MVNSIHSIAHYGDERCIAMKLTVHCGKDTEFSGCSEMIGEYIKKENTPLVSVVMPAYNKERYIEQAIRSVMNQTYPRWEMIVVDDGSSDATRDIVESLVKEDSRIRLVCNGENCGAAVSRNRAFGMCQGSYVALLDSDDLWYPEKLERQVQLAQTTGADIVYCSYGIIDQFGNKHCEDFIVPEFTTFDSFLTRSVISCSTALLSNRITKECRFETEFYHEDLVFWFQLLKNGYSARGLQMVLAQYRVMTGTKASNKVKSAMFRWQIYRKYLGIPAVKSAKLLLRYAVLGFRKYKKYPEAGYEKDGD